MPWQQSSGGPTLAVNVIDMGRMNETVRAMLLGGKLDVAAGAIRTDPSRLDEAAVAFSCDLLTAACCLDVMRGHDRRAGDYPARCYLRTKAAWNKLPGHAILTLNGAEGLRLNPEWFSHVAALPEIVVEKRRAF